MKHRISLRSRGREEPRGPMGILGLTLSTRQWPLFTGVCRWPEGGSWGAGTEAPWWLSLGQESCNFNHSREAFAPKLQSPDPAQLQTELTLPHVLMAWQIAMTCSGDNIIIINNIVVSFTSVSIVALLQHLTFNPNVRKCIQKKWWQCDTVSREERASET